MKTIELTDEQYTALLIYKNFVSTKISGITNPEVQKILGINPNGVSHVNTKLEDKLSRVMDFEPEYSFGKCIVDTIGSVMNEQQTGKVNYIT